MNQLSNGTQPNNTTPAGSQPVPSQQAQGNNPLGPSPSTAVAMIILYSITGIITALFLVIIVTGAVRAHRHPERYGPRNIMGRPRQSRARGLARAMLDGLPIVKFGEREAPKPTDVELAAGTNESNQAGQTRDATEGAATMSEGTESADHAHPRPSGAEEGIAAATEQDRSAPAAENMGCSICTEDFEIGQDQRVLPCDHRFHPACIDPWLLNVSGTCPLCRIDLRPQTSRTSDGNELDADGNPIPRSDSTTGELPPPLETQPGLQRSSIRRSIMIGILGPAAAVRPERMSREERVLALRQYRGRQLRRRRTMEQQTGSAQAGASTEGEEESGLRTRLRNVFRVRTSRTGQAQAEEAAAPAPEGSGTSGAHA